MYQNPFMTQSQPNQMDWSHFMVGMYELAGIVKKRHDIEDSNLEL
jgi:hypothetical protein